LPLPPGWGTLKQVNRKVNMAAGGNKPARFRAEARQVLSDIFLGQAADAAMQPDFYCFLMIQSLWPAEWTALILDRREWG